MTHFHVGYNIAGCLPEMEPDTYATLTDAEQCRDEYEREGQAAFGAEDCYVYWVQACTDPRCEVLN